MGNGKENCMRIEKEYYMPRQILGADPEALSLLQRYNWPHNYTQFRRVIEELAVMGTSQIIRLNVSQYTIIISQYGESLSLFNLDVGMRVNAEFSAAVTSSIPPQSSAYSIIVLRGESDTMVTTDNNLNLPML